MIFTDLIVPEWPAPKKVKAFVTLRGNGCSTSPYDSFNLSLSVGDTDANVKKNREILRKLLPDEPRWLKQVHGTTIVEADTVLSPLEADASFSRHDNIVCALMIADCIPVLICDKQATVVAAVHAGWRGLLNGILEKSIKGLNIDLSNLLVYLGPAIGAGAFEIGQDVYDKIISQPSFQEGEILKHPKSNKWYADLISIARNRLTAIEVKNIFESKLCTFNNPNSFFSHRRSNPTGRMAACIWLEEKPSKR